MTNQSVDCVVFGYENHQLKVLLSKWEKLPKWSLQGGYVFKNEDLDLAALRVLKERTGLTKIFLKQFHTFGSTTRRNEEEIKNLAKLMGNICVDLVDWHLNRFITTGYFAFVKISDTKINSDLLGEFCQWHPVYDLPPLIYDHQDIIEKAIKTIREQINYLPIGYNLLSEKFTMNDLLNLHENILNKPLDRGNFQKKMLKLNMLKRHEKLMNGGAHKAPYLYSFNQEIITYLTQL